MDAVLTPARLLKLATEDGEPAVRSAAAGRLLSLDTVQPHDARRMLDGFDEIVAAMAADWLVEHPDPATESSLVALLEEADEPTLLTSCLHALKALYSRSGGRLRPPETPLDPFLAPLYGHPDGSVRAAAFDLALSLDLNAPSPWHALATAPLDELRGLRSARVRTSRGSFIVELLPDEAPLTVWNFAQLARSGFFDNLRFHRIVPDFVVQGGDPRGDGNGGPGWSIPDEPSPLPFDEGTLGMALSGPDTGGSQWFVTLSSQPHLDGTYPVFGRVLQGMQVVRALQPTDRIVHIDIEGPPGPRSDTPTP